MAARRSNKPSTTDVFDVLVRNTGATRARVIEEWAERSAIREYLGGVSRAEAEKAALREVENVLTPRTR